MKDYISHNQARDFCVCKRLYYLKHISNLEIKPKFLAQALKAGKLWDVCLQIFYTNGNNQLIYDTIEEYEIDSKTVNIVKVLYRVYKEIIDPRSFLCQHEIIADKLIGKHDIRIKGILDRYSETDRYFVESKLSSRPDWYQKNFHINDQLGTYFLISDTTYCILEVIRFPQQKKNSEYEDISTESLYQTILSHIPHYFIGYDFDKRFCGRKYFRLDFDIQGLIAKYDTILRERDFLISLGTGMDAFYKSPDNCYTFGAECPYMTICDTGKIDELRFKQGEK